MRARLQAWTTEEGIAVSDDGWTRLDRLVGLWQRYGRAINLVGSTDRDALAEHVREALQSLACAERVTTVDEGTQWIDVGSGGGLPGLVIAAVRPCMMILIEPRERRAAFLELGLASVGVGRGAVIRGRWGDSTWNEIVEIEQKTRSKVVNCVLSSRAVFRPDRWLEEARRSPFSRGIVLCHVENDARSVGGESPRAEVRGPRWTVMAFAGEERDRGAES